mmetsp:Transcript_5912/g.14190  ORF Transcript_5912/g.14190 Transcript_5912/m.14190 type:complete len:925 (-) Transcript_5912:288-3062(-)
MLIRELISGRDRITEALSEGVLPLLSGALSTAHLDAEECDQRVRRRRPTEQEAVLERVGPHRRVSRVGDVERRRSGRGALVEERAQLGLVAPLLRLLAKGFESLAPFFPHEVTVILEPLCHRTRGTLRPLRRRHVVLVVCVLVVLLFVIRVLVLLLILVHFLELLEDLHAKAALLELDLPPLLTVLQLDDVLALGGRWYGGDSERVGEAALAAGALPHAARVELLTRLSLRDPGAGESEEGVLLHLAARVLIEGVHDHAELLVLEFNADVAEEALQIEAVEQAALRLLDIGRVSLVEAAVLVVLRAKLVPLLHYDAVRRRVVVEARAEDLGEGLPSEREVGRVDVAADGLERIPQDVADVVAHAEAARPLDPLVEERAVHDLELPTDVLPVLHRLGLARLARRGVIIALHAVLVGRLHVREVVLGQLARALLLEPLRVGRLRLALALRPCLALAELVWREELGLVAARAVDVYLVLVVVLVGHGDDRAVLPARLAGVGILHLGAHTLALAVGVAGLELPLRLLPLVAVAVVVLVHVPELVHQLLPALLEVAVGAAIAAGVVGVDDLEARVAEDVDGRGGHADLLRAQRHRRVAPTTRGEDEARWLLVRGLAGGLLVRHPDLEVLLSADERVVRHPRLLALRVLGLLLLLLLALVVLLDPLAQLTDAHDVQRARLEILGGGVLHRLHRAVLRLGGVVLTLLEVLLQQPHRELARSSHHLLVSLHPATTNRLQKDGVLHLLVLCQRLHLRALVRRHGRVVVPDLRQLEHRLLLAAPERHLLLRGVALDGLRQIRGLLRGDRHKGQSNHAHRFALVNIEHIARRPARRRRLDGLLGVHPKALVNSAERFRHLLVLVVALPPSSKTSEQLDAAVERVLTLHPRFEGLGGGGGGTAYAVGGEAVGNRVFMNDAMVTVFVVLVVLMTSVV